MYIVVIYSHVNVPIWWWEQQWQKLTKSTHIWMIVTITKIISITIMITVKVIRNIYFCVQASLCICIFSRCHLWFLAATTQLNEWYFCPSVRLSHLFHYVPIIVSSQNFQQLLPMTRVRSMQKVKDWGQRSRSQRSQPNPSPWPCAWSQNRGDHWFRQFMRLPANF